jgi:hypothetical protein
MEAVNLTVIEPQSPDFELLPGTQIAVELVNGGHGAYKRNPSMFVVA